MTRQVIIELTANCHEAELRNLAGIRTVLRDVLRSWIARPALPCRFVEPYIGETGVATLG